MKTISRYIMTLALLLTAVGGAWAADYYVVGNFTEWSTNPAYKMTLNTECTSTTEYILTLDLAADAQFKVVKDDGQVQTWYPDGMGNNYGENGELKGAGKYTVYFRPNEDGNEDWFYGVINVAAAESAPTGPAVTISQDTETKQYEASFKMPQYDVTATYTIKRDMSIQMTAQVGDDPAKQPRYRVKKDGNNKFIPAEMEMAAVPALFTVNDGIEQKALTLNQDYYCLIYKLDEQTKLPEGDGVKLADFDFAPGLYALKAFAEKGSDYAGETELSNTFQLFQGYQVEVAAKEFITYFKDEPLYADTETSADAELYTITSVSADQATLSAAIETAPRRTPLLIFNNSDEAKTFLLIPANAEPNLQLTVAPEFVGTLEATTIAASTDDQTNYAFNGKAFVFVKNDLPVAANKAWLRVNTGVPSARITIVFEDATKIANTNITNITNGEWYTIDGRKVNVPSKKGIYIMNGKKVVVK